MRHDGILAGAKKGFDLEVLFNPFEEQFNLPTLFVDVGNGLRRPAELIADEDIVFAGFRIAVANSPDGFEWFPILACAVYSIV